MAVELWTNDVYGIAYDRGTRNTSGRSVEELYWDELKNLTDSEVTIVHDYAGTKYLYILAIKETVEAKLSSGNISQIDRFLGYPILSQDWATHQKYRSITDALHDLPRQRGWDLKLFKCCELLGLECKPPSWLQYSYLIGH